MTVTATSASSINGDTQADGLLAIGRRLLDEVLLPMKQTFVGKDEIIDLMGICLVAGENLFFLGPPGTAKSALVSELGRRLEGRTFEYLLTRFTEPSELFGPFDIRKLREGELVTNTEGMLPEASLVFLDELLNANSAILNSLLGVLNERVLRRGREDAALPTLMVVGASNRLPEDDALGALFDRFLVRVPCDNVPAERLAEVLHAGWRLDLSMTAAAAATMHVEDARRLHRGLGQVDMTPVLAALAALVLKLRHAGVAVSDRRAVKLQRLVAASALLSGRRMARLSDLWVFRHIWDTVEQQEILAAIVQETIAPAAADSCDHPRSRAAESPDPQMLAGDLDGIEQRLGAVAQDPSAARVERAQLSDRLSAMASRCQWVKDAAQREFLEKRVAELMKRVAAGGEA